MRVIALLSLLFGFMAQTILDGQTFTHAVLGVVLGAVAGICGMVAARKDPPHRWEGWIMAVLGVVLGVWCIIMLPSAYRFQAQFNKRVEEIRLRKQDIKPANKASEPTSLRSEVQR